MKPSLLCCRTATSPLPHYGTHVVLSCLTSFLCETLSLTKHSSSLSANLTLSLSELSLSLSFHFHSRTFTPIHHHRRISLPSEPLLATWPSRKVSSCLNPHSESLLPQISFFLLIFLLLCLLFCETFMILLFVVDLGLKKPHLVLEAPNPR